MLEISNEVNLVRAVKWLKIKNVLSWFVSLGIPLILVIIMCGMLIARACLGADVPTNIIPSLNLLVQGNLWLGRRHGKKLKEQLKNFENSIQDQAEIKCAIYDLSDIQIIPKNIKLGEDLSKKNIVEIFKEGHYVLVHSYPEPVVIRQYVDDDEELHVDVLTDKDRKEALNAIYSDPESAPKKLSLWNRF